MPPKPCAPLANGRPRVRNPQTGRCKLAAAASSPPKKKAASSPPKKAASSPPKKKAASPAKACLSPETKIKVPGKPKSYTFLQLVNDTKLYWGSVVMALTFAMFMRNRASWWTTMVTNSATAQYLMALNPHPRIAKVLAGFIERLATLKTGWTVNGAKSAHNLCILRGNNIVKKAAARAKELTQMMIAICSAKIGDDKNIDTAYRVAFDIVRDTAEDPEIRKGVQGMLSAQLTQGHGLGISEEHFNKFSFIVHNMTISK